MNLLKIKSHAKINLALDVLGKSGKYHKVQTVLQEIDLFDTVTLKEIPKKKIIIKTTDKAVPTTPKNLAYQAAEMVIKAGRVKKGVEIFINKHIPVAGGFGGGSSNAATVLLGLNKMWDLKLKPAQLEKMAAKLGMDVPFFLYGKTAVGTHFGEKIKKIEGHVPLCALLLIPDAKHELVNKTKLVYKKLNTKLCGKDQKKTKALLIALKKSDKDGVLKNLHNDIETVMDISEIRTTLMTAGASGVVLSGSGPSIVALFKNKLERKQGQQKLDPKFKKHFRLIQAEI